MNSCLLLTKLFLKPVPVRPLILDGIIGIEEPSVPSKKQLV